MRAGLLLEAQRRQVRDPAGPRRRWAAPMERRGVARTLGRRRATELRLAQDGGCPAPAPATPPPARTNQCTPSREWGAGTRVRSDARQGPSRRAGETPGPGTGRQWAESGGRAYKNETCHWLSREAGRGADPWRRGGQGVPCAGETAGTVSVPGLKVVGVGTCRPRSVPAPNIHSKVV